MSAIGKLGPNEPLIGQQGSRSALSTPALVLDLDRLERNIAYLADYLGKTGHGVRPVAKIHKSVEVAKRQMEAGALGQCCATLAEAEVMADAGIAGVLLFSQVVTEPKIARLAALNARADGLLVAVDDAAVVDRLGCRCARRRASRSACWWTSRWAAAAPASTRGGRCASRSHATSPGPRARSTPASRATTAPSSASPTSPPAAPSRSAAPRRSPSFASVSAAAKVCAPEIVSGGGTGTYAIDADAGLFTECQAGSYIFMDVNYADTPFEPDNPHPFETSLFVRTTVISARDEFAITDAGIKELQREEFPPRVAAGAHPDSLYELVGDDMGRLTVPEGETPAAGGGRAGVHRAALLPDAPALRRLSLRARRHARRHLAHRRTLPVVGRVPDRAAPCPSPASRNGEGARIARRTASLASVVLCGGAERGKQQRPRTSICGPVSASTGRQRLSSATRTARSRRRSRCTAAARLPTVRRIVR